MPSLLTIGTPGLIAPENVAAGNGGQGVNEILGSVERGIGTTASLVQQHQQDETRVWAGNALSDFHVTQLQALQDQRDAAAKTVAGGGAVPDMTGDYLKSFDQGANDLIAKAPNRQASLYLREQLAGARASLGAQMVGQQATLTREWKVSSFDSSTINSGKIVQQDPTQFDAQMGNLVATMPNVDPATDQRRILAARESLTNAAASSTLDRDPYALKALTGKAMGEADPSTGKAFSGPTGTSWIDQATPEQITTWNRLADAKIKGLENAKRLDADAAERNGQTEYNLFQKFVAEGNVPDLAYAQRVQAATKGTSFEASANAALEMATRGGGFGSASLPAQQARLEQMQARQAAGTNPEEADLLKQLSTIHQNQIQAYKDDPIEAAGRYAHAPVMPTQQIASVQQGLQVVAQRAAGLPAVEVAAGVPVSPLHPDEAKQMGLLLRSLPIDQRATALSSLGTSASDPQRIAALAKQLGDTDGNLGLMMAYAGDKTAAGRLTINWMLHGEDALKTKTSDLDKSAQTGWTAQIAKAIPDGVFSDAQVTERARQAALLVNAGRSAMGNGDDIDASVKLVTGGIIEHGAAGAKIPLPFGMTEDTFDQKLAAVTPASLKAQVPDGVVHIGAATVPLQQFVGTLKDATLVHAGQGLYNVRGGTQLATNAAGQRITIRIAP